jgi:hypothetical protein
MYDVPLIAHAEATSAFSCEGRASKLSWIQANVRVIAATLRDVTAPPT